MLTTRQAEVERQHEFSLEQYRQVRTEFAAVLARLQELFRYALLGIVIVYSWVLTQAFGIDEHGHCLKLPSYVIMMALVLPPLFVVFGVVVAWMTGKLLHFMSAYLRKCERKMGYPHLCWTDHIGARQEDIDRGMNRTWFSVLVVAVLASTVLAIAVVHTSNNIRPNGTCIVKGDNAKKQVTEPVTTSCQVVSVIDDVLIVHDVSECQT